MACANVAAHKTSPTREHGTQACANVLGAGGKDDQHHGATTVKMHKQIDSQPCMALAPAGELELGLPDLAW